MANRLKEKLKAGEPAFGVSVMFPSPQIVEMVGKLGFDWVMIDCEHGSVSPESIETMAMAAELTGITPIARPWTNSAEAILRVMDRGAMGVQVPHVNTADDAKRAVEAEFIQPASRRWWQRPRKRRPCAISTRSCRLRALTSFSWDLRTFRSPWAIPVYRGNRW